MAESPPEALFDGRHAPTAIPIHATRGEMIDERQFRDAMSLFASGVTIVAADDGERAHGLTVASFASVSLAPPLCLVCIKYDSSILPLLRESEHFSVNFLKGDERETALLFARGEPSERQKRLSRRPGLPPTLDGALARVDLRLTAEHTAGDHQVLIGAVTAIAAPLRDDAPEPLLWWRGALGPGAPKT